MYLYTYYIGENEEIMDLKYTLEKHIVYRQIERLNTYYNL